jgi:hypothetical protein
MYFYNSMSMHLYIKQILEYIDLTSRQGLGRKTHSYNEIGQLLYQRITQN